MSMYRSPHRPLPGTSLTEVLSAARHEYHIIQKRTPRRIPYIRSRYFVRDKIFVNTFWEHLKQKHPSDQMRRLRLYACGLDLIRNAHNTPTIITSQDNPDILLHRFYGISADGVQYCVQIKENKRTNRKDFMSVFPTKQEN